MLLLHKQWGLIGRTIGIYKIKEVAEPSEVDFHKDVVNHKTPGLSEERCRNVLILVKQNVKFDKMMNIQMNSGQQLPSMTG